MKRLEPGGDEEERGRRREMRGRRRRKRKVEIFNLSKIIEFGGKPSNYFLLGWAAVGFGETARINFITNGL